MIDKLLLEHVGLPHVLDLAVHLVNFFGWMSQGGHSEQLLLLTLFRHITPSCLKVIGWVAGGGLVAHKILVSAPVPWIGDWGPELDNFDLDNCPIGDPAVPCHAVEVEVAV